MPSPQRDDEFILIKVEGYLFKVPARNFIAESEVFETMFKLPQNPNIAVDGISDSQPLRLEGVQKDDFRQLLRVMYTRYETTVVVHYLLEQWPSVLKLSTKWDMGRIRSLAIKKIRATLAQDDLLPYTLLKLGQEYRVDEWVISAIVFFIKRAEPMQLNDVETIGIENALKIASLRECCMGVGLGDFRLAEKRGGFMKCRDSNYSNRIKELFDL